MFDDLRQSDLVDPMLDRVEGHLAREDANLSLIYAVVLDTVSEVLSALLDEVKQTDAVEFKGFITIVVFDAQELLLNDLVLHYLVEYECVVLLSISQLLCLLHPIYIVYDKR